MSSNNTKTIVEQIRDEFDYQICNFNNKEINRLVHLIRDATGNIHFCGVGKSGNISNHCCDLLKSISIPAYKLEVLNSTHGDIGSLREDDIVIFFSASGNTDELVDLATKLKHQDVKTVSVCCTKESKLSNICSVNISTPFKSEIGGNISSIPTNSIMSQLLFVNILTSLLKTSIDIDQYKLNHTSGSIGKNLLKIKDILIDENYPVINIQSGEKVDIYTIMLQMTECKIGCCCFIDKSNNLIGILTGGDCRRLLLNKKIQITDDDLNTEYYYERDINLFLSNIEKLHVKYIPVINQKTLIGIIDTADVIC